jgi:ribosomal protein S18 acetylase RimI-like enzyme
MIEITRLKEANEQAVADIGLLLQQLRENPEEHHTSLEELRTIVEDNNIALLVVKDGERIVGMASLYMMTKFSKRTAEVEDVVVDSGYRGKGLGEKLMQAVIDTARAEHIKTLHLTSRPERVAGNKLYQKLGFELKKTNPYRLKL